MSDAAPDAAVAPPEPPAAAPRSRAVVQKAQPVPLPRRLISIAVIFAALVVALDALPRPYAAEPLFVVDGFRVRPGLLLSLTGDYAQLEKIYGSDVPKLEPVAGEADAGERHGFVLALGRHHLGLLRELALRLSMWAAAGCFGVALALAGRARVIARRAAEAAGLRLEPRVLQTTPLEPAAPPPPIVVRPSRYDEPPPPPAPSTPEPPPVVSAERPTDPRPPFEPEPPIPATPIAASTAEAHPIVHPGDAPPPPTGEHKILHSPALPDEPTKEPTLTPTVETAAKEPEPTEPSKTVESARPPEAEPSAMIEAAPPAGEGSEPTKTVESPPPTVDKKDDDPKPG